MPSPHAEERLDRSPVIDRRAVALGVVLFGVVLVFAPTVFWPPVTVSQSTLQVGPIEGSAATDPTAYRDLPPALQQAFDATRQASGSVDLESAEVRQAVRRHPYVSHEGTTYRLGVYRSEQSSLGVATFGPFAVAVGATAIVVGWQVNRRRMIRPLTPVRALLVPLGTLVALWVAPSTGGLLTIPPALGLAVPAGTLLVPAGSLCMTAGRRYVLLGPIVGLAAGLGTTVSLGANPTTHEAILGTIAVVAIPWFVLGALLSKPRGAGR